MRSFGLGTTARGVLVVGGVCGLLGAAVAVTPGAPGAIAQSRDAVLAAGEELPELRTRKSRTFVGSDGNQVTRVWPGSVNYRARDGVMRPIDNTLVRTSEQGGGFRNAANRYRVFIPDAAAAPVRVESDAGWLSFGLADGRGAPTASGATARLDDALAGVDVVYTATGDAVKEDLVLSDAAAPRVFRFKVDASAGFDAVSAQDGSIEFRAVGGDAVFGFAAPVMFDADGASSGAVSYELSDAGEGWELVVRAQDAWLEDPDRAWPVTVDPTVTIGGQQNTYMTSGSGADSAYGPASTFSTGLGGDGRVRRGLIQFDVSGIPDYAIVVGAKLALRTTGSGGSSTVAIHRATRSWTGAATWNRYDGVNAWTTPGGQFASAAEDTEAVDSAAGGWEYWYLNRLAQDWIDGSIDNYGLLVKSANEAVAGSSNFYSMTAASSQPFLEIEWSKRLGVRRDHTFDSFRLSDRIELMVNVASGNLVVRQQDLLIKGTGLPVSVERWYNGFGGSSDVGRGWSLDVGQHVRQSTYDGGDTVVIYAPSGVPWRFRRKSDGSFMAPPAAVDADLKALPGGGHELTFRRSGEKWEFGSAQPFLVSRCRGLTRTATRSPIPTTPTTTCRRSSTRSLAK